MNSSLPTGAGNSKGGRRERWKLEVKKECGVRIILALDTRAE
jgi:hypothetical protein